MCIGQDGHIGVGKTGYDDGKEQVVKEFNVDVGL
jgi:hypothetical protein